MTNNKVKCEIMALAVMAALLATVALVPLKNAEAQNATSPKLGEHLSKVQEKMTEIKTNHPELGTLADRMQTMNVTEATAELAALLDFGQTMMGAVKNLQGNMTAATN
jgi:hypothetical protein